MEFDFEANYPKTDERGRTKKDALELIQICSASYEFLIKDLVKEYTQKYDKSQDIKNLYTFRKRLNYLKSKKVINQELFSNLVVLSEIRNKIHELLFNKKTIFLHLSHIKTANLNINEAPNDCRKYLVVISYCCIQFVHILEGVAPESIMRLEAVPETEFKVIEE